MLFNSFAFLIFFPLFTAAYWPSRGRARLWLCLLSSYLFYGWWDWRFVPLLWVSTLLDFVLGTLIGRAATLARRRALLAVSIVANLSFLGFFKYFNFFVDSGVSIASWLGM